MQPWERPKRQLKIDISELELAFDYHDDFPGLKHYLDLETGEVLMVRDEERSLLDEIYERHSNLETGQEDWERALSELNVRDWQKDELAVADRIEGEFGSRYIAIPHEESYEGYNDMAAFIGTVANPRLQGCLEEAIQGKGAFRRFKDLLFNDLQERERWFAFQNERHHQRVLEWLESIGIEPIS